MDKDENKVKGMIASTMGTSSNSAVARKALRDCQKNGYSFSPKTFGKFVDVWTKKKKKKKRKK
jgi:hypothetical protein